MGFSIVNHPAIGVPLWLRKPSHIHMCYGQYLRFFPCDEFLIAGESDIIWRSVTFVDQHGPANETVCLLVSPIFTNFHQYLFFDGHAKVNHSVQLYATSWMGAVVQMGTWIPIRGELKIRSTRKPSVLMWETHGNPIPSSYVGMGYNTVQRQNVILRGCSGMVAEIGFAEFDIQCFAVVKLANRHTSHFQLHHVKRA